MNEFINDPPINSKWTKDYDREPHWRDLDENDIEMFYDKVKECVNESEEVDNIQWERMNYNIVDADFYRDKMPGFCDEFYELLADSTNKENKVQDFRQPTLDINQREVILKFSTEPENQRASPLRTPTASEIAIEDKIEELKIV